MNISKINVCIKICSWRYFNATSLKILCIWYFIFWRKYLVKCEVCFRMIKFHKAKLISTKKKWKWHFNSSYSLKFFHYEFIWILFALNFFWLFLCKFFPLWSYFSIFSLLKSEIWFNSIKNSFSFLNSWLWLNFLFRGLERKREEG